MSKNGVTDLESQDEDDIDLDKSKPTTTTVPIAIPNFSSGKKGSEEEQSKAFTQYFELVHKPQDNALIIGSPPDAHRFRRTGGNEGFSKSAPQKKTTYFNF